MQASLGIDASVRHTYQTCSRNPNETYGSRWSRRRRRAGTSWPVCCSAPAGPSSPSADAAASPKLVERTFASNWRSPLPGHDHAEPNCRPVIALGKFDALHKGHQSLAAAALQLGGSPVLLSFSGMGSVLGWQPRKPLVAPCDRPRVLDLWAKQLNFAAGSSSNGASGDGQHNPQQQQQPEGQQRVVRQHYIPFSEIRSMSPEDFIQFIVDDLKAVGVVAGANYRFGYRAAGDAALLQQLCGAAGVQSIIVDLVGPAEPGAVGVVSSSKIREMLSACRIEAARKSLGRPYRLVATLHLQQQQQQQWQWQQSTQIQDSSSSSMCNCQSRSNSQQQQSIQQQTDRQGLFVPQSEFLNQHPASGVYLCNVQLLLGATAHDDLLEIQRAIAQQQQQQLQGVGAAWDSNPGSSSSSGMGVEADRRLQLQASTAHATPADLQSEQSDVAEHIRVYRNVTVPDGCGCFAAVVAQQQQIELQQDGLLLPAAVLQAAYSVINNASGSSSSSGVHFQDASCGHTMHDGSSSSSSSSGGGGGSSTDTSMDLDARSSSSSSRVCSIEVQSSGLDPVCWDTDDNDDDVIDSSAGVTALLVVEFEKCLRQVCSVVAAAASTANTGAASQSEH